MTSPRPRPVSLVVVKGMKSCVAHLRRQPGPLSATAIATVVRAGAATAIADRRRLRLAQRVERVLEQVDEDLLQPDAPGDHRDARRARARGATVTPASRIRPASSASAPSIAAATSTGRISPGAAPREAAQRLGDRRRSARSRRRSRRSSRARPPVVPGVEKPPAGLGIGADRRERLVDLVGDAGRDLPEDRQPVGLGELVAQHRAPASRRASRSAISAASAALVFFSCRCGAPTRRSSSAFIAASAACRASAHRRRRSSA